MLEELKRKRDGIIEKICSVKNMVRGVINEQYIKVPQKDAEPELRGPYYVLTKKIKGKTKSQRIKSENLEVVKTDVNSYKQFRDLANEFVEITEQITYIERKAENDTEFKKN